MGSSFISIGIKHPDKTLNNLSRSITRYKKTVEIFIAKEISKHTEKTFVTLFPHNEKKNLYSDLKKIKHGYR